MLRWLRKTAERLRSRRELASEAARLRYDVEVLKAEVDNLASANQLLKAAISGREVETQSWRDTAEQLSNHLEAAEAARDSALHEYEQLQFRHRSLRDDMKDLDRALGRCSQAIATTLRVNACPLPDLQQISN